jgi:hypothetical protein
MFEFIVELFGNFPEVMLKTFIVKPYFWLKKRFRP